MLSLFGFKHKKENVTLGTLPTKKTSASKKLSAQRYSPLKPIKLITADMGSLDATRRSARDKFIIEANQDICALNLLISEYNIQTKEQKLLKLHDIYLAVKQMDDKFPDRVISDSPSYRTAIYKKLFSRLKKQYDYLNQYSQTLESIDKAPVSCIAESFSLPHLLLNISPEKAAQLIKILLMNGAYDKSLLRTLFSEKEPEYAEFQAFLRDHTIAFLGGGNSKNFKITSLLDGYEFVLKIDSRLDMPKNVESHLRSHSLSDTLTNIFAERRVSYTEADGKSITKTLLITEYCSGGDLDACSAVQDTAEKKISSALNIFKQMATILLDIEHDECAFPDMKNTNWLMNSKGLLHIADTKSFVFTDTVGRINFSIPSNRWCRLISTTYMGPPELYTAIFSADKMHAYMLGKNLYQYLTGCSNRYLSNRHDGRHYDFSAPLFQTENGNRLKLLIQKTIKPDPANRITINETLSQLIEIQISPEKRKCLAILSVIKSLGLGKNDIKMNTYILQKAETINSAKSQMELDEIQKALEDTLIMLQKNGVLREVKAIIQSFRDRAGFFTVGMKDKAARIERAMAQVPIHERESIFIKNSFTAPHEVLQALASHRNLIRPGNVHFKADGSIDEEKAAKSFKKFKEKILKQKEDQSANFV